MIKKCGDVMYWFYMLKKVKDGEVINLETDVFISENRDTAKKLLSKKLGNLPFRKPKNATDGTKYIYLTESDQYWYDYHHLNLTIECYYCTTKATFEGEKNLIKNRVGVYCSTECKDQHEETIKDVSDWINESDHVGLKRNNKSAVIGYIYKITNKHTMKCYVGQTIKPALFRWWQHLKTDRKFEQDNIADLVFEVIEVVEYTPEIDTIYENAQDKLNKREAYFIALYNCVDEGYNSLQPKVFEHDLFTISLES